MTPLRLAAPFALLALPALAGNLDEPVVEPVAVPPVAIPAPVGEWTGFYLGGQLGFGNADLPGADLDGALGGVHAGYLHDLGDWVVGGEIDYDVADLSDGPNTVDSFARAKLIAGYDLGQTMIYGTAGAFRADMDTAAGSVDDTGPFAGLGIKHRFTDTLVGGLEALYHQADDFGGAAGNDFEAVTLTARLSYQF